MNTTPRLALWALCAAALAACSSFERNTAGSGYGVITIGTPRVESRERLTNDRRQQEEWLRERLDIVSSKDTEFGFDGLSDLRSLAQTSAQLGVNIDPGLKLDQANRQRLVDAARQAADDERALTGFRNSARDQVLARFNKGELTAEQTLAELDKLGLKPPAAAASAPASAPPANAGSAAAFATRSLAGAAAAASVPDGNARRTVLTGSPLDDFQDRLAAREMVRNEINDVRLDDRHDLAGNTLYRLTFSAGILPQDDASAWAVVEMHVRLPEVQDARRLLERAREAYVLNTRNAALGMYRRVLGQLQGKCYAERAPLLGRLQPEEPAKPDVESMERAFRSALLCATKDLGSNARRDLERQAAAWTPAQSPLHAAAYRGMQQMMLLAQGADENERQFERRRVVLEDWAQWLGRLVEVQVLEDYDESMLRCFYRGRSFDQPFRLALAESRRPGEAGKPEPAKCGAASAGAAEAPVERFTRLLQQSIGGYAYAATPKESVQRLSEVTSNRKATELLLGLSAVTGTAGVSAGLQSLRAQKAYYQAIKRQPLVVGVTPAPRNGREVAFGWILGPQFQLSADGKRSQYRHTVVQRSLAAEVSLPAWLDKVTIDYTTRWQREDGSTPAADSAGQATRSQGSFEVRLPAQPLQALAAIDDAYDHEPRVDSFQYLDAVEGEPAAVLITGRNLWRSTEVYIGAQQADRLSVTTDSKGVLARFDKLLAPHGSDTEGRSRKVALKLITSQGQVQAGNVTIAPPADTAPPKEEAKPKPVPLGRRILPGQRLTFSLAAPLDFGDRAVVRVGSSQDTELRVPLTKTTQLDEDLKTVTFVLAQADVPNLVAGDPIKVDLTVTKAAGQAVEQRSILKAGVFYTDASQTKATAAAKGGGKAAAPLVLTWALPRRSATAFESLTGAVLKARVKLTLEEAGGLKTVATIEQAACPIEFRKAGGPDGCKTAALPLPAPLRDRLKDPSLKGATLKAALTILGDDVPAMDAPEVVVAP